MNGEEEVLRHLQDLYRRAEKTGSYVYSGFLSLTEQDLFEKNVPAGGLSWSMEGGRDEAERRILVCGSERDFGYPPEVPLRVVRVRPRSEKFSEVLTHRDYLGAVLALGIERSLIGDILLRGKEAYVFCLESIAGYLTSLEKVRRTSVTAEAVRADIPELAPRFEERRLNVAAPRLDAVVAAFCGLSRNHAAPLFPAGRVFVGGRPAPDGSRQLKEGDVFSVRGFGKAIYDGVCGESKKGRLYVSLRQYV